LKGLAGFSHTRQTELVYNPPVAEGGYKCEKQKTITKYKRGKIILVLTYFQVKEEMPRCLKAVSVKKLA